MIERIKKIQELLRNEGFGGVSKKIAVKLWGNQPAELFPRISPYFQDKSGIEIGGVSPIFSHRGLIPLYPIVKNLDGCNFSTETMWEGKIQHRSPYRYLPTKTGIQFICEAVALIEICDEQYDFVISSNCLEHVANPIKAVAEWRRVLKTTGALLTIVPNKHFTFDHRRPITTFEHILSDYETNKGEDDLTHLDEILFLHDLERDKPAGSLETFKERSLQNAVNRGLHHHVFDLALLKKIYAHLKLEIALCGEVGTDYLILGLKH